MSGRNQSRLEDALLSLSLANLCLLRVWGALFNPANHYFLRSPPRWHAYAMALLAMGLLAAAFFLLGRWSRSPRHPGLRRLAPWGLLGAAAVALNAVRQHVDWLSFDAVAGHRWGRTFAVAAALALVAALAAQRSRRNVIRGLRLTLLALAPFCLVTFVQAAAGAWTFRSGRHESFTDKPTARPLKTSRHQVRLVFLVFDGLDQELLFSRRPADLRVPTIDRLWAEAVSATQAYPVDHSTAVSLPSLLTGRVVRKVKRTAADELYLWTDDTAEGVLWSAEDNLFRRSRALGLNAALVGWYHPYCRILAADVANCAWYAYVPDPDHSPALTAGNELALLVETVPLAARFDLLRKTGFSSLREGDQPAWHLSQYRALHARALEALADPEMGVVFVHYPIPHWPYIYNRLTRRFDTGGDRQYVDNLTLVDQTLEEIQSALSTSGLSERSAILLTSDHWLRHSGWRERAEVKPVIGRQDQRVPLLLFIPGAGAGAVMDRPVLNVVAQDLGLAVLRRELTAADHVVAWLEARAITGPGLAPSGAASVSP